MRNGYVPSKDVFRYKVACPQVGTGYAEYPVLDGLRKLGLLRDKSGGINSTYMTADEDTRLAVIAGLIDSDGYYDTSNNTYRFTQSTEGHRKIVYDLKELALSCGISVTGVHLEMRTTLFRVDSPSTPTYVVYLGKGSVKFQKHLLLPRKKMNLEWTYINHDARPFTVSDAPTGEYRAIEVSGGQFQLATRLVVCN
jgi:hypothetical protein